MEIQGQDGSRTQLKDGSELIFGRGKGFHRNDLAVSRRHISFRLTHPPAHSNSQAHPRVSFEVIGKNPIWVCDNDSGEIRAFKRFDKGELGFGDLFCFTSKDPVWFSLNKVEENERGIGEESERKRDLGESLELETSSGFIGNGQDLDLGFESIDVSGIDPVKEFGFLVIGHEFDNYPKEKIRDVKSWNWFLEDPREDSTSEDEDESSHGKRKTTLRRKRKKKADGEEDDEEWTGEGKDEEVLTEAKKLHGCKYSTRSKDHGRGRHSKDTGGQRGSAQKRSKHADEELDEEEEDDDETLGGFIVDDVEEESEGMIEDEDEEEEFEEDEDD